MEEIKKRGRKKKVIDELTSNDKAEETIVHKKRGRKKKWETTPFKNNYLGETSEVITFDDNKELDETNYNVNKVKFGNLCIKIHDKETEKNTEIFEDVKNEECLLTLSSDDEETLNNKNLSKKKTVKIYSKGSDKKKCFNCHHFFENNPFYLPYDYCKELDRYKIYGNFCSPNCVKTYCINSKQFENKQYLIGHFYRKLFGYDFRIKPAPSYLFLKEYGGNLTIEEYRASFYSNNRYTLNTINCKIIKDDFISY